MVFKSSIRYLDYVCDPPTITIEANYPAGSVYLLIDLKVHDKSALNAQYKLHFTNSITKEDINKKVKTFCNAILLFTKDEIYEYVDEDKTMLALYAHQYLQEVKTRTGSLIWKRP